jgi:ABC-type molybdenum transport system, ATPase component/photorepair protein PhrA
MTELFSIKDLSIRRGDVRVLDHINWTMRRGEHWVILGANGSGKTSLLKALTGYMPPTDGSIVLLGEEFGESDWRELRRHVGVVSASISHLCHDEDEAEEIVAGGKHAMIGYWGRIAPAEQRRARRLLRLLGVSYAAGRRWEVLSQGERQRVLIARALMADPAILILDEPCSGLDPVAREHFLSDLRRLAAQAKAPGLVLVTHHIEEILPEFTHLLALENGKTHYAGPLAHGLTSRTLSAIFHAPLTVRRQGDRYRLSGIS